MFKSGFFRARFFGGNFSGGGGGTAPPASAPLAPPETGRGIRYVPYYTRTH